MDRAKSYRRMVAEFARVRRIPNVSEFRHVTVLFIRLVGMDYNKGISELKRVQSSVKLIQQLIIKHGGNLMRFSIDDKGAGVLGVFGLPP
eukprot:SAG31_NODE_31141_length_371_cov_1.518382_1_plen_89_part_10